MEVGVAEVGQHNRTRDGEDFYGSAGERSAL